MELWVVSFLHDDGAMAAIVATRLGIPALVDKPIDTRGAE